MYSKILYAVQLDEANHSNLEKAIDFARAHNAELVVANAVVPVAMSYAYTGIYFDPILQDSILKESKSILAKMTEPYSDITYEVLLGHPAESITSFADEGGFDAILINGHHHKFLGRIGSVAENIVNISKPDVIVFK